MKNYKIFLILFSAILFFTSNIGLTHAQAEPDTTALQEKVKNLQLMITDAKLQREMISGSYLVMDISDNSVISGKNINQAYPIASITKLMNAVITVENVDMNQSITLQKNMLKPWGYSPSLFLNLIVSAKNLLRASLIQSTNDAAESLTYFIGHQKFLELMNQKAKELGMEHTYFYDAHGLSPKNHSSSSDIAKLVTYIYKNHPEILSATKDDDFWLPDSTGRLLKFQNLNNFYKLPEFIGGKTGYLPEAKQSLASVFNLNGRPVIIVLLYSKSRQADTFKVINLVKNNF